ncbi:hypothetical protein QBC34DRAFT_467461 [Podospora aff. communis PSN243]|uniref:Uncharacterized protein n=1 Tax=Podospora aff. communis PSN243 TaxID=3040156 RepID=A0AAV9GKK1_9PEZI|nr:hypothetical protein QBC34DRAFT_467461 [Podospora aff. communis PSN243]
MPTAIESPAFSCAAETRMPILAKPSLKADSSTETAADGVNFDVALLPKAEDCLAHLSLLEALLQLRCRVAESSAHEKLEQSEQEWDAYVRASAVKFTEWVSALNRTPNSIFELPSLEALMVWHAFMLNPVKYAQFEKFTNLPRDGLNLASLPSSWDEPLDISLAGNMDDSSSFTITATTGNLTTIPFDLPAAVHRQHSFATKMTRHAWHRSPTPTALMHRSITRYANFFSLLKSPNTAARAMAVPTLDVDLIWHTHQLSPEAYRSFSKLDSAKGGFGFVNHDDDVDDGLLRSSFRETQDLYRAMFGAEYSICLCWACAPSLDGNADTLHSEIMMAVEKECLRRQGRGLTVAPDMAMPRCGLCGEHEGRDCPEGVRKRGSTVVGAGGVEVESGCRMR